MGRADVHPDSLALRGNCRNLVLVGATGRSRVRRALPITNQGFGILRSGVRSNINSVRAGQLAVLAAAQSCNGADQLGGDRRSAAVGAYGNPSVLPHVQPS